MSDIVDMRACRLLVRLYNMCYGYFDIGDVMEKLKTEGSVKVPFKMLYDIRQYDKALDGCYMEIVKAA